MKVCTCFLLFRIFAVSTRRAETCRSSIGTEIVSTTDSQVPWDQKHGEVVSRLKLLALQILSTRRPETCRSHFGTAAYSYTTSSPFHSQGVKQDINLDVDLKGALEFEFDKNSLIVLNKRLIESNKIPRRNTESKHSKVETFTDFLQEAINVIYTYDDKIFEDFFRILEKEITKYNDNSFKFHELTDDNEIRNLVKEKFDFNEETSIRDVGEIILKQSNDNKVKELLHFINTLYEKEDRQKFQEVFSDLKAVGYSNNDKLKNDLSNIIRNAIRAIVINHYTDLTAKQKRGLKKEIIAFLKSMDSKSAVRELKTNISTNINSKVKELEILKNINTNKTSKVQNKEETKRRLRQKIKDGDPKKMTKYQNKEENKRRRRQKLNDVDPKKSSKVQNKEISKRRLRQKIKDGDPKKTTKYQNKEENKRRHRQKLNDVDPKKTSKIQTKEKNKRRHSQKTNDRDPKKVTTVQNKVENKRQKINGVDPKKSTITKDNEENKRRYREKINEDLSEKEETTEETSEEESDSQQLVLTFTSTEEIYHYSIEGNSTESYTDESSSDYDQETYLVASEGEHRKLNAQKYYYDTLYIEDFYNTSTVTPKTVGKVDEGMWVEGSTDRLTEHTKRIPTTRPNIRRHRHRTIATSLPDRTIKKRVFRRSRPLQTTSRFLSLDGKSKLYAKDLRRSTPSLPNKELSLEVFEREKRKRDLASNYSFITNNSIEYGLKDFVKSRRHLYKTVNELKKTYEINLLKRLKETASKLDQYKNAMNVSEAKDKIYKDTSKAIKGNINETKVANETQNNNLFVMRARPEENETEVRNTPNDINKTNLFNKLETDLENKEESEKTNDTEAIKLEKQKKAKKSTKKKSTKTQTTGYYSSETGRTPVILSLPLLSTVKENSNITESTSIATKEVGNVTTNVTKEIIDNKKNATAAAVDVNKVTTAKNKLNVIVTPSTRRYRRVLQYSSPPF